MVESVSRLTAPEKSQWPAGRHPASQNHAMASVEPEANPDPRVSQDSSLAAPDRLGYAKLTQISHMLTSLAAARTGARDRAAFALRDTERKLRLLKAEAEAVAACGSRAAAVPIARALAKLAREIADAARDDAAAGSEAGLTAAEFADAVAAIDIGAASEGNPFASGTPQAAATEAEPEAASPLPTDDADAAQSLPEDAPDPRAFLRQGSDVRSDRTIEAEAHALLDEAVALKRAMMRILRRPRARPEASEPTLQIPSPIQTGSTFQTGLAILAARPKA